jgi:predicted dehydrogenase
MRLALIGCGLIGAKRAAAAAAAGHQIVVTCDPHRTRREALARQTGAHPVADWREALALDIEAVMIATFHDQLAEIALAAVAQNRHVLVEKPGARTADELHPIEEALRRSQCVMKVGFNHRFHPAVMRAKRLLDEDAIGRPMFVRARYGHGGRLGYEQEWRFDPKRSGGGDFWPGEVDDNCFLALTNHDGAMAWLQASWTEWKNVFSFEVMGRDGKLTIEGLGGSYGVERLTHHRMLPQMGPPETTIWEFPFPDRSFADEFENFIAAIEGREEPLGDIRDAIANLEIIRAVYRGSL